MQLEPGDLVKMVDEYIAMYVLWGPVSDDHFFLGEPGLIIRINDPFCEILSHRGDIWPIKEGQLIRIGDK